MPTEPIPKSFSNKKSGPFIGPDFFISFVK